MEENDGHTVTFEFDQDFLRSCHFKPSCREQIRIFADNDFLVWGENVITACSALTIAADPDDGDDDAADEAEFAQVLRTTIQVDSEGDTFPFSPEHCRAFLGALDFSRFDDAA